MGSSDERRSDNVEPHYPLTDADDGVVFCEYDNEVWPCAAVRRGASGRQP